MFSAYFFWPNCPPVRTRIFQVDAFATRRFTGNPAAMIPMDRFLDDAVLRAENNLAPFLFRKAVTYRLRCFTPLVEVPLCDHAALASAAVVMKRLQSGRTSARIPFRKRSLTVNRAVT